MGNHKINRKAKRKPIVMYKMGTSMTEMLNVLGAGLRRMYARSCSAIASHDSVMGTEQDRKSLAIMQAIMDQVDETTIMLYLRSLTTLWH